MVAVRNRSSIVVAVAVINSLLLFSLIPYTTVYGDDSAETAAFNYIVSLLPQLITIVVTIGGGFKFLQSHNEKRVTEMEGSILTKMDVERQLVAKDIREIHIGIDGIDRQNKIVTEYIKDSIERHDRILERLDK